MEHIFLKLWNMSISAGWVILAVLALRFLLKRAPKNITVLLWGAVGVRLLCPFSLKSAFSLLPTAQTLAPQALYQGKPELNTGIPAVNEVVNPVFTETFEVTEFGSVNPLQVVVVIAANVWLLGVIAMALYGLISYTRLRRKVSAAALLKDRIWLSDHISTPFILGWIRPKIFLPSEMEGGLYEPVIAHELTHIRRGDHWIKLLGFVLLCVYWFQPLVWLAYILLCRDIELACDERVVRDLDTEQRKEYSEALLCCGIKTKRISACPLAFGEVGVKQRIKAVLHYKKPTLWIVLASIVAAVALIVCFLTDPKALTQTENENSPVNISEYSAPINAPKISVPVIEVLRVLVPHYFNVSDINVEVYVWDEGGVLWCGLMPGTNSIKTQNDLDQLVGVPLGSMAKILQTYDEPRFVSIYVVGSSRHWGEPSKYVYGSSLHADSLELWLRTQLDLFDVQISQNISTGIKKMYVINSSGGYGYQSTGRIASEDQLGHCITDKAVFDRGFNPSGLYQTYEVSVYTVKGEEDADYLIVDNGEFEIYQLIEFIFY